MFDEKFLDYLETNYEKYCSETDLDTIRQLLDYLDGLYYNTSNSNHTENKIIADSVYDWINDFYYSSSKQKKITIGYPVKETKNKVKLPYFMGSMDKIKPNSPELDTFFKKYTNDKCISEKLDGISLLLEFHNSELCNIYKRGDGFYGHKINHIKKYINFYSRKIDDKSLFCVRGELIISKQNWNILTTNYNIAGKNARNFISGFTNRKEFTEQDIPVMKYIDFVAFELIHPTMKLNQEQQLLFLQNNFKIVKYEIISNKFCKNSNFLIDKLREYKNQSFYDIDGIIIQDNQYYSKIQENPKHSKAFKNDKDCVKVHSKVIDIEWNISKDGLLKPVIIIEPIHIDGVDISRVTGNNGKFIVDNNISYGTNVSVIRSGGVIPKIVEIDNSNNSTNSTNFLFPKIPWEWDKNKVEFITTQKNMKEIIIKQIEHFVITMGIEFYKISTIIKSYNQNIITSIDDLYTISQEKLLQIEGIKEKSASKILTSIRSKLSLEIKINELGLLASATPFFKGLGSKRLELIFTTYPTILNKNIDDVYTLVIKLNGFSEILTNIFTDNIIDFKNFLQKNNITIINDTNDNNLESKKIFVFSGFRDKLLKQKIIESGNIVSDSITSKTNYLVIKDRNNITEKIKKATEKGIQIIISTELNNYL